MVVVLTVDWWFYRWMSFCERAWNLLVLIIIVNRVYCMSSNQPAVLQETLWIKSLHPFFMPPPPPPLQRSNGPFSSIGCQPDFSSFYALDVRKEPGHHTATAPSELDTAALVVWEALPYASYP
jgi:hypothetical protein